MMDFSKITETTSLYNFHSHSQFCDGRATMAEFAEAACAAAFQHLGFTPHSPICVDSPCNMSMENVAVYLAEAKRLKREYEGRMEIYTGMEIDFLGSHWGPPCELFRNMPLDYSIGSIHFIPAPDGSGYVDIDGRFHSFSRKMTERFNNDLRYVVDTFFNQSEDMLALGGFDIVGHIDKVALNASLYQPGIDCEPWFEKRMVSLLETVRRKGYTLEINTKQYAEHGRMFPDPKWFPLVKRLGIPVVVNSDVHYPALVNASRPEALRMFAECGD